MWRWGPRSILQVFPTLHPLLDTVSANMQMLECFVVIDHLAFLHVDVHFLQKHIHTPLANITTYWFKINIVCPRAFAYYHGRPLRLVFALGDSGSCSWCWIPKQQTVSKYQARLQALAVFFIIIQTAHFPCLHRCWNDPLHCLLYMVFLIYSLQIPSSKLGTILI